MRDGFPGQRFRVLAPPTIRKALTCPLTRNLLVTDAGYFPHAAAHGRIRRHGVPEVIVIVCVGGSGTLTLHETLHHVGLGDVAVIPPNLPHMYLSDHADPWSIWWLHAAGSDATEIVQHICADAATPIFPLWDVNRVTSCIERAIDALEVDDTEPRLYEASGAAWQMFAYIASDVKRGQATPTTDRIQAVQDYLRANLASALSTPELARMANLSPSHFSALFHAATGMAATEYVKRLRSARARELLVTTTASIAEIAQRVGYSDAFYFSRQFRAVNGVSPTEFRRRA